MLKTLSPFSFLPAVIFRAVIFCAVVLGACGAMVALSTSVEAQSYSLIDGDLSLYCADLPNATNMLVSVGYQNGLSTVVTLDPQTQKKKIIKLRKDLQKRISALSAIKKSYDPRSDGAKLKQIYKFVANEIINDVDTDGSLNNLKPNAIFKKIGALISQLKGRISDLNYVLKTIDRCLNNEELIPPPAALSTEVITFPFVHPDYGTTEWMRGLGVTAILNKKRSSGVVCVSTSKTHSTIRTFPKESAILVHRNPCLMFWQRSFRNYPFCKHGTHRDSAVGWFNTTSAGFSSRTVDDREKLSLQGQLDFYGPIHVRAPTKKKPCRTK